MPKLKTILFVLVLSLILFYGCNMNVNRSIHIRDGEHVGGQTSVNGSIHVGSRCRVDGNCRTVNGSIEVGDDSQVGSLDTVNGRITLAARVVVDGNAGTVNGSIRSGNDSKIHGRLTTVNGRIELKKTEVDEALSTVNGNILLLDHCLVHGDLIIRGRRGHFSINRRIEIRIENGSVVEGNIDVRDPENKVDVYIGKDADVKGEIRHATVIREKPAFVESPVVEKTPQAGR